MPTMPARYFCLFVYFCCFLFEDQHFNRRSSIEEFPKTEAMADDTYQMSGKTGSLRYMAPEVAKEKPYNETVDVYSLAILAWQIFEMDIPFRGYSIAMHNDL